MFCLRYLAKGYSLADCTTPERAAFADTLYQLSQREWLERMQAPRHGSGCEKIRRSAIRVVMPPHITGDVTFLAFRFFANAPMVGYREGNVFRIVWLDRRFTLYDHG